MYINCSIISERGVINMAHTYSYRADSKDHDEVKRILDNLGLDMSTSIKMYFKQIIRHNGIPFSVTNSDTLTEDTKKALLLAEAKDMGLIEDDTPAFKDTNKLISYMKKRAQELE